MELFHAAALDVAIGAMTHAAKLQSGLAGEFSEMKIHLDLAKTQNALAEVHLWLAVDHPDRAAEHVELSRTAAELAGKIHGPRQRPGDRQNANGLAWSLVTLAALKQLEGGSESARLDLAREAKELLVKLPGGERALGRGELVTFALACSLSGDVRAAYNALRDATDRGENTAVRFEQHGRAGLGALAADPTFGSKFRELCHRVRSGLKSD